MSLSYDEKDLFTMLLTIGGGSDASKGLERLVEMMSVRPREIFGIEGGRIEEGAPADLCALYLEREWIVRPEEFLSMGRATPFENERLFGKNVLTVLRGEIVYEAL